MKIVSYLRVSTRKQGVSGLGLDAQRVAIDAYSQQRHAKVVETFTEIESGNVNARPELAKALHLVRLGNPNGAAALKRAAKGNAASVAVIRSVADSHAKNLQPVIQALAAEGKTSLGAVAEALNQRGMLTPRGGRWHKSSVRNLLDRLI